MKEVWEGVRESYILYTRNQKKSNSGVFITRFANQYVLRFFARGTKQKYETNQNSHDTLTRNTRKKLTLRSLPLKQNCEIFQKL